MQEEIKVSEPTSQTTEGKVFGDDKALETSEEKKQRLEQEEKERKRRDDEILQKIEDQMSKQDTAMKNTIAEIMNGGPIKKDGDK